MAMRPIGLGLAVAVLVAALSPLGVARAASKTDTPAIPKDQRDKGMAAAPGLISAGGFDCQVADARFIGEGADAKTKAKISLYELACTGNEGLLVQKSGDSVQAFTCQQANEPGPDGKQNSTRCLLPQNLDAAAGLVPYIAKAGKSCVIAKARALGQSPTNAVFELACQDGSGWILAISAPPRLDKPATMDPCVAYPPDGNISCKLTDRAAQLAIVDRLIAKSGKTCTVKDRAYVGATGSGDMFYEAACQEGKGYMIAASPSGDLKQAIDCAAADAIAGGCKLTDARQAKTEQAGLYTKFAAKAGFQCTVSGYAPLPSNLASKDVVELACSNRPDGAIGIFGATESDPAEIIDCAHAELKGYRCGLTKASAAYSTLTTDLKTLGKSTCQVSNSRAVGVTADQHGYIEVACSDGLQGYMIEYTLSPITPKAPIVCAEAKGISGGCTLAGNTK
jgi:hypothetical protein